jgi:hypothetical protein
MSPSPQATTKTVRRCVSRSWRTIDDSLTHRNSDGLVTFLLKHIREPSSRARTFSSSLGQQVIDDKLRHGATQLSACGEVETEVLPGESAA